MTMTNAQAKRTRLKVFKDLLKTAGGTLSRNDTLYRTIRKLAVTKGVTVRCCAMPYLNLLLGEAEKRM